MHHPTLESDLIVTCISDSEGFAGEVYGYLLSKLEKQREYVEGRDLKVDRHRIILAEDEIRIGSSTLVPKDMVKWVLQSFLSENKEKFKDYDLIEFGDAFTIGKVLPPSKMEMVSCEICGFFTPYAEELQTHRMTHFGL